MHIVSVCLSRNMNGNILHIHKCMKVPGKINVYLYGLRDPNRNKTSTQNIMEIRKSWLYEFTCYMAYMFRCLQDISRERDCAFTTPSLSFVLFPPLICSFTPCFLRVYLNSKKREVHCLDHTQLLEFSA